MDPRVTKYLILPQKHVTYNYNVSKKTCVEDKLVLVSQNYSEAAARYTWIFHITQNIFMRKVFSFKNTLKVFSNFRNKQKSVWSKVFWYVKACIFWKCIQYTIHWDKTQTMDKINGTKNPFFLSRAPTLLLLCDSYISWSTMFVSLKLCLEFPIFDYVSFLRFVFLFNKMHGLFNFET